MIDRRDSRYRAGGPMDDVAQNIRNEQRHHGIDKNPSLECAGCGETHNWKHFKNHGQASADPDKPLLCSVCNAGLTGVKSDEQRREDNRQLEEFADG